MQRHSAESPQEEIPGTPAGREELRSRVSPRLSGLAELSRGNSSGPKQTSASAEAVGHVDDDLGALLHKRDEIDRQKEEIDQAIDRKIPLLTVMFIDLCSSTRIFFEQGDLDGRKVVQRFREQCLTEIESRNPIFVDLSGGDQIISAFSGTEICIDAAVAALKRLEASNRARKKSVPGTVAIDASVGIHCGKVPHAGDRLEQCNALNLAKRLQDSAGQNQIFVSQSVFDHLPSPTGYRIAGHGAAHFKNIPQAQHVYEIHWKAEDDSAYRSGVVINAPAGAIRGSSPSTVPGPYHNYAGHQAKSELDGPEAGAVQEDASPTDDTSDGNGTLHETHPPDSVAVPSAAASGRVYVAPDDEPCDFTSIGDALAETTGRVEIVVRSGTYRENVVIDRDDVTLLAPEFADVVLAPPSGIPLRIVKAKNVRVEGIEIAGAPSDKGQIACLLVDRSKHVSIHNCRISDSRSCGCVVCGSADIDILKTRVTDCRGGGVYVTGLSRCKILGCEVTDNGGYRIKHSRANGFGLLVDCASSAEIQESTLGGNEGSGIVAYGCETRLQVIESRIQGNGVTTIDPGVYVEEAQGKVTGSHIVDNGGAGVYARGADFLVTRNTLLSNGRLCKPRQPAILFTQSPKSDARRNHFQGNGIDTAKRVRFVQVTEPAADELRDAPAVLLDKETLKGSRMWYDYQRAWERHQRPKEREKAK